MNSAFECMSGGCLCEQHFLTGNTLNELGVICKITWFISAVELLKILLGLISY